MYCALLCCTVVRQECEKRMSLYGVPLPLPSIKELLQDGAASIKQEFPPRPAVPYAEESNQQVQHS